MRLLSRPAPPFDRERARGQARGTDALKGTPSRGRTRFETGPFLWAMGGETNRDEGGGKKGGWDSPPGRDGERAVHRDPTQGHALVERDGEGLCEGGCVRVNQGFCGSV
eukprot:scaffold287_cov337-Pavlova_lutheri.AAC.85